MKLKFLSILLVWIISGCALADIGLQVKPDKPQAHKIEKITPEEFPKIKSL